MKNFKQNFKSIVQRKARWLLTLLAILTLGVGQMWGTYYWSAAGTTDQGNSWGATAMTESADGYYWYYKITCAKPGNNDGFKIRASNENWNTSYGYTNVSNGFNGTDITDSWNNSDGNAHFYDAGANYYILFYPTNTINTTGSPIICASTYLPSGRPRFLVGANWTDANWENDNAANQMTFSTSSSSYSKDISITDATKEIALKITAYNDWSTTVFDKDDKGTGYNLSQALGGSDNLTFKVSHAGTTKITLTSAGKINVYGPYQVSYAAGTGATGTVSASAVTTYGSTCTLSSSTFTKSSPGYVQDGWSISDGGSKAYGLGASYTGGYTDVTLYPHWVENTYDVTINNDGNGSTTPSGKQTSVGQVTGSLASESPNGEVCH